MAADGAPLAPGEGPVTEPAAVTQHRRPEPVFMPHSGHSAPLALVLSPNGDLIPPNGDAVNGGPAQPSEIVEFTKSGEFVGQFNVDAGQGGAFGIGVAMTGTNTARLAVVDDNANDIIVIDQNL